MSDAPRAPLRLRCEGLADPLGLGEPAPRLSWWLDDERPGALQSGYEVRAASSEARLAEGDADRWDSGRVASAQTHLVPWGGAPLRSRDAVVWRVRTFDGAGAASPWSAPARFELGLLERADWSARFVASPLQGSPRASAVVPALRVAFALAAPFVRARLYATALGLYELSLNGSRVGDELLAPGWTDYRRRVRTQTYDVTTLLRRGENVLGALLGDGWYCGFVGMGDRELYGARPALLAQLEVERADGSRETIASDGSWRWHPSEILASDLLMGETVDLRQRRDGGSEPGAPAGDWRPVDVLPDPGIALDPMTGPPVRASEERAPVGPPVARGSLLERPRWIFDFGQNLVGHVRLRVCGPRGTTVRLRHAEVLDGAGELYTENLRGALQTDTVTLRGDGAAETFEPRFSFHGFRYLELSGFLAEGAIEDVRAVVLHSDVPVTGRFSSSHALLDRLHANVDWGLRGNFVDVPTDCPQRDERLGWTGDAQVFVRTACFHRDVAGFFRKWFQDVADAQGTSGQIPPVVPAVPLGRIDLPDGGPAWADAAVICPWVVYRCYGDTRTLERSYASMCAFVDEMVRRCPDGIRADPAREPWGGFGDWLALDGTDPREARVGGTPKDLIGTAFFAESARLVGKSAALLGRDEDARRYAALADGVRDAFRRRFVTPDGRITGHTQTGLVLALHFGLLEPAERARAGAELAREVESRGGRLTTGFVGTPYILSALTEAGRLDLAYRLLLREQFPSWLFPILHGATTVWERWDGWTPGRGFQDVRMNSFNHYAYGAVGEWIYGSLAGLDLDPDPGPGTNAFARALLRPRPPLGRGFSGPPPLTRAAASFDSVHGRFETAWRIEAGAFHFAALVPPNASATVVLPDGSRREVRAGRHAFETPLAAIP